MLSNLILNDEIVEKKTNNKNLQRKRSNKKNGPKI